MARIESQALGGYYPLPPHIALSIGDLIDTTPAFTSNGDGGYARYGSYAYLDPCAGKGEALHALAGWFNVSARRQGLELGLYACELEEERAEELQQVVRGYSGYNTMLRGDAFRIYFEVKSGSKEGMSLMLLNPPYDTDPEYGREEHRWLTRFTYALTPGSGVLVYVVPHYALKVSAEFFAEHYEELHAFRFPREDFEAYKQVVILATRRSKPFPFDVSAHPVAQQVRAWATSADDMPVLRPGLPPIVALQPLAHDGFAEYQMTESDLVTIQQHILPWRTDPDRWMIDMRQPIPHLLKRIYPVAMPPRPAHIAEATAAGVLNSFIIEPDDPASGMPPLMIRGMYSKEQVIIEEKEKKAKDGSVETQEFTTVEQPLMRVSVLDMNTYRYYKIQPGETPTDSTDLSEMNIADLLTYYGHGMAAAMMEQCPPLHDPSNPNTQIDLPSIQRPLWAPQEQVAQAALKLLHAGDSCFILGEVGTGKTSVALAIMQALQPDHIDNLVEQLRDLDIPHNGRLNPVRNVIVMCPPHMLTDWQKEARIVLPGARVLVLNQISDIAMADEPLCVEDPSLPGAGLTIMIMSRERGKLGHLWRGSAYTPLAGPAFSQNYCPDCGRPVAEDKETLARKRVHCHHDKLVTVDEHARMAERLAAILGPVAPDDSVVQSLMAGRRYLLRHLKRAAARRSQLSEEEKQADVHATYYKVALHQGFGRAEHVPLGCIALQLQQYVLNLINAKDAYAAKSFMPSLLALFVAMDHRGRDTIIFNMVRALFEASLSESSPYGAASDIRNALMPMTLLLQPDVERDTAGKARRVKGRYITTLETLIEKHVGKAALNALHEAQKKLWLQLDGKEPDHHTQPHTYAYSAFSNAFASVSVGESGRLQWRPNGRYNQKSLPLGGHEAAVFAMHELAQLGQFRYEDACNAPLYQAIRLNDTTDSFQDYAAREARIRAALRGESDCAILDEVVTPAGTARFPLATYICHHRRDLYDLLVLDEAHEYNTKGSAQEIAAHRLSEGKPTIVLTGTLTNGYSSSLFANMWALSRRFRNEFGRDEQAQFVDRYGYRKVKVIANSGDVQPPEDAVAAYGRVSDRVVYGANTRERKLGEAPGILPLFTMSHLLPSTVTIHKSDLAGQLIPEHTEYPVMIKVAGQAEAATNGEEDELLVYTAPRDEDTDLLFGEYRRLQSKLMEHIAHDMFQEGLAGKLWGAMSELPSYLDRATADTGNGPGGIYEIRYPESVGGELVAAAAPIPADVILPKEAWILQQLEQEMAEGRNTIVFAWHVNVIKRLQRITTDRFGDCVSVLRSERVPTKTRKVWIDENVVGPGKRILITNPVPVSTGLNNLIWFNTAIWAQDPNVNPVVYRQACGRIIRPGHTAETIKPVRIYMPVYAGTIQDTSRLLLGRKISASLQADGQDVASTLAAVGGGSKSDGINAMRAGQALYHMLLDGGHHKASKKPQRGKTTQPSLFYSYQAA